MFKILFLLTQLSMAENSTPDTCGRILNLQGQVEVLRLKEGSEDNLRIGTRAQEKMNLECRDIILTARSSRAKIRLKSTVLTLAPNSRFSIEEHDPKTKETNLLNLTYGKIRTLVNKKPEGQSGFKVSTPNAVMGVRGTDFFTSFDPNTSTTEQATISGSVEVEHKTTGQKALVKKGMQTKVEVQLESETPQTELKVVTITPKVVEQIKQTSYIAKDDKEFKSEESTLILGAPEKWLPPEDELPLDLKGIKNEF